MLKGILGRKVGMTQVFLEDGTAVPVTVIQAGPCHVLQVRTPERDGYAALQLGFDDKPRHTATRSERGHVAAIDSKRSKRLQGAGVAIPAKANCEPKRFVREFRGADGLDVGAEVKVDVLADVASVDVVGHTKGRGFAGVMKRWRFKCQRATHGVKKAHRQTGSTGCRSSPGRVFKGLRMGGRYGNERVTSRNLKVIRVDAENNLLLVRGAVPGPAGGVLIIKQTNKVG
jgi:large subunit ribosomal protein L3